ncbi:MAG: His-Xaa-Ser system protein HxsD [Eggerthellaceae bacterium]|nr:His-Xaa-Ser system protein HxsD [Eggerthellaceae bacterium]
MKDYKIPIVEVGATGFKVSIDLSVYSMDAITSTSYRYTDRFYVYQQTSDTNTLDVILEAKDSNTPISAETVKQFCNDLIDQQVRTIINRDFGRIRDMIVEEAFKPVNK